MCVCVCVDLRYIGNALAYASRLTSLDQAASFLVSNPLTAPIPIAAYTMPSHTHKDRGARAALTTAVRQRAQH